MDVHCALVQPIHASADFSQNQILTERQQRKITQARQGEHQARLRRNGLLEKQILPSFWVIKEVKNLRFLNPTHKLSYPPHLLRHHLLRLQ